MEKLNVKDEQRVLRQGFEKLYKSLFDEVLTSFIFHIKNYTKDTKRVMLNSFRFFGSKQEQSERRF